MEHLAIMKKSWRMTEKILTGEKKIESRWYKAKYNPWDKIKAGETVYFKNSGEPVSLKAKVDKVMQISGLSPDKVKEILKKYGKADGIEEKMIGEFYRRFKGKKYCILIFLKNPAKIKPFQVNKKGFGTMSAWISVDKIKSLKVANW